MVYGYRMGVPMCFDLNFDGLNLPRRSADIGPSGPGVIVAQGTSSAPPLTSLQVGDVVVFDADVSEPVEGQTDHVGIYLGVDSGGHPRMISSRKSANGPTMSDLGGSSTLDGTGTYATRLRIIRRF
jgi:cell wall-associated NlpC family hydrolase